MLSRLFGIFRRKPLRIEGVDQLPDGMAKKVTLGDPLAGDGLDLILVHLDGQFHALDSRCPHAGGFITDGPLVEGKFVNCPLHHYKFDPKTGACDNAPCGKAKVYKTQLDGGTLSVYV